MSTFIGQLDRVRGHRAAGMALRGAAGAPADGCAARRCAQQLEDRSKPPSGWLSPRRRTARRWRKPRRRPSRSSKRPSRRGTNHRTAARPGRCRGGTDQDAGCPTGRAAARPAHPAASPGARASNLCARQGNWCESYVADPEQQSATVDRFLDELDAMAPSPADVQYPVSGEYALGQPARRWAAWSRSIPRDSRGSRQ